MTLAALLALIPPRFHESLIIYRIKPPNEFDATNRVVYVPKRYVAVREDGYSVCSCMQGIHFGIPCQHFFAVSRRFPHHGFNIHQLHQHWILLSKRQHAHNRPWIHLDTDTEENNTNLQSSFQSSNTQPTANTRKRCASQSDIDPAIVSSTKPVSSIKPVSSTRPTSKPIPSMKTPPPTYNGRDLKSHEPQTPSHQNKHPTISNFDRRFPPPSQRPPESSPSQRGHAAKRRNYGELMGLLNELISKTEDQPLRTEKLKELMRNELSQQEDYNLRANFSPNKQVAFDGCPVKSEKDVDVGLPAAMEIVDLTVARETSLPLDPIPVPPTPGPKSKRRLKSGAELWRGAAHSRQKSKRRRGM
jgi:hypothetical protein